MWRKRKNDKVHLACEDFDFVWYSTDVTEVCEMWRRGDSLATISEYFGRDPDEVVLLLIDLGKRGLIGRRPGGPWGSEDALQHASRLAKPEEERGHS